MSNSDLIAITSKRTIMRITPIKGLKASHRQIIKIDEQPKQFTQEKKKIPKIAKILPIDKKTNYLPPSQQNLINQSSSYPINKIPQRSMKQKSLLDEMPPMGLPFSSVLSNIVSAQLGRSITNNQLSGEENNENENSDVQGDSYGMLKVNDKKKRKRNEDQSSSEYEE
ncbi:MAG: hypothetical protein EZS28_034718 [Streblomastix strix]|uniref:Uncharacterized protein n=1 Tax=Streblomastix strix TaxID=222440 RepID=A0A5J4UHX7_9EUKA|nr:MAG: hypothetical protein EZS28_034718 [Streblomastix strix]